MTNLKLNQQELSGFQKTGQIVKRYAVPFPKNSVIEAVERIGDAFKFRIRKSVLTRFQEITPDHQKGGRLNVEVDKATLEAEVTGVDCKQEDGDWFFDVTFKLIK